jgi:putative Mg2+ transporter-C (MgtC) family protein
VNAPQRYARHEAGEPLVPDHDVASPAKDEERLAARLCVAMRIHDVFFALDIHHSSGRASDAKGGQRREKDIRARSHGSPGSNSLYHVEHQRTKNAGSSAKLEQLCGYAHCTPAEGETMPLALGYREIAIRLVLTLIASMLLGFNRSVHGHVAGLRTMVLVGLAAAVAMIQANLLLVTDGKTSTSFSVLDLMRLPLGILTGMGFIGAGAIVRHDETVSGVTTAALLWLATVVGLCFGGGQLALGSWATVLALLALSVLGWLEKKIRKERRGRLTLETSGLRSEDSVRKVLARKGYTIAAWSLAFEGGEPPTLRRIRCDVQWRGATDSAEPPPFLQEVSALQGISQVNWEVMPK